MLAHLGFHTIIGQFIFFTASDYLLVHVKENENYERHRPLELKTSVLLLNSVKDVDFDKLKMGLGKDIVATNKQDGEGTKKIGLPNLDTQNTFASRGSIYFEKLHYVIIHSPFKTI